MKPKTKTLWMSLPFTIAVLLLIAACAVKNTNGFDVLAYADYEDEEKVLIQLSSQPVSFAWANHPLILAGGGKGELFVHVGFICEGQNLAAITYSAENCSFAEYMSGAEVAKHEKDYDLLLGEGDYAIGMIRLGPSYAVDADAQQDKEYVVCLPLHAVDDDYAGNEPVILSTTEETEKWIYSLKEKPQDWPTGERRYIAQGAKVVIQLNYTNGKSETKTVSLEPRHAPNGLGYTIDIALIED